MGGRDRGTEITIFAAPLLSNHQKQAFKSVFIHSSIDGHLDCFYILAIVNNAEMSIEVQISL